MKAGSRLAGSCRTTRSGEAPRTIRLITGKGQEAALPISPGIRGKRDSSIRMPTGAVLFIFSLPLVDLRRGTLRVAGKWVQCRSVEGETKYAGPAACRRDRGRDRRGRHRALAATHGLQGDADRPRR